MYMTTRSTKITTNLTFALEIFIPAEFVTFSLVRQSEFPVPVNLSRIQSTILKLDTCKC